MTDRRLVIFDIDGTLVDSQHLIWSSFAAAYDGLGFQRPERHRAMRLVGRSLDLIFPELSPDLDDRAHRDLAAGYRAAYHHLRETQGAVETSPLYPGARDALLQVHARPGTALAVATGKSRRGLSAVIAGHGFDGMFVSLQCADDHPSKPHPAMLLAALDEAGVAADRAVMIGDTTYDMDMARAAGVATIGVTWGFHAPETLDADVMLEDFGDLTAAIDRLFGVGT